VSSDLEASVSHSIRHERPFRSTYRDTSRVRATSAAAMRFATLAAIAALTALPACPSQMRTNVVDK